MISQNLMFISLKLAFFFVQNVIDWRETKTTILEFVYQKGHKFQLWKIPTKWDKTLNLKKVIKNYL